MNDLQAALQITLIGMGLVFGSILILWGLMYLLTLVTQERGMEGEAEPTTGINPELEGQDLLRSRAAAVAVALALAEQESSSAHPLPPPPTAIISAWQLGMRTRQMYQKGHLNRKGR